MSVTATPFVAQWYLSAVASVALASNAKSLPFVTTIFSSEIGSPQTLRSVGFVVSTVHVQFVATDLLPASSFA